MEQDAIIAVRGLTAAYGDEVILKDISFEVKRGEVFVILGGSGCGKSTLLKHLIGLYPLASGEVLIDGENLATAAGRRQAENFAAFRRCVSERSAFRIDDIERERQFAHRGVHPAAGRRRAMSFPG